MELARNCDQQQALVLALLMPKTNLLENQRLFIVYSGTWLLVDVSSIDQ